MTMNRILFLCSGNYYRSRFAEELFNFKARAIAGDWRADSRGLSMNPNNAGPIAEIVLKRLDRLEVKPANAGRYPEAAEVSDLDDSDLVIAMSHEEHYPLMQSLFPEYAAQTTYWDVEDTGGMPPEVALPRIEWLVARLAARLIEEAQLSDGHLAPPSPQG